MRYYIIGLKTSDPNPRPQRIIPAMKPYNIIMKIFYFLLWIIIVSVIDRNEIFHSDAKSRKKTHEKDEPAKITD